MSRIILPLVAALLGLLASSTSHAQIEYHFDDPVVGETGVSEEQRLVEFMQSEPVQTAAAAIVRRVTQLRLMSPLDLQQACEGKSVPGGVGPIPVFCLHLAAPDLAPQGYGFKISKGVRNITLMFQVLPAQRATLAAVLAVATSQIIPDGRMQKGPNDRLLVVGVGGEHLGIYESPNGLILVRIAFPTNEPTLDAL